MQYMTTGSRKIAPEENCLPALILTLILNQTLTLTGGNFHRGHFSGHHNNDVDTITHDLNRGCLVYMFSLRFCRSKFLINLRRQFRVRK